MHPVAHKHVNTRRQTWGASGGKQQIQIGARKGPDDPWVKPKLHGKYHPAPQTLKPCLGKNLTVLKSRGEKNKQTIY